MSGDQYYPRRRYQATDPRREVIGAYDIETPDIDDLVKRNPKLVSVQTLDLRAASTAMLDPTSGVAIGGQGWFPVFEQGWGVVIYGHDGTAIRTVNTTAFVACQFNQLDAQVTDFVNNVPFGFPMKHARGFYGPFNKLFLRWPLQANVYCDLVIFKSPMRPWIDGEVCT